MRACFHPDYALELPAGHPFPMSKYPLLRDRLLEAGLLAPEDIVAPEEMGWDQLALVHTPAYLAAVRDGTLTRDEERRLGLPWSPALVRRGRLAVAGTLLAARMALEDGLAANLAGGTHHAFADRGEGFCLFNDMAVALRVLLGEGSIRRALVVDLDVHQGNGTAALFEGDPAVYTFSQHGAKNFPFRKERSRLDVELPDGCEDDEYLELLAAALPRVIAEAAPDLVVYLAGVDVVAGDRFGRLKVTEQGLAWRDRLVFEATYRHELPVVMVLGGGYAKTPHETARLHVVAHREARAVYGA